MCQFCRLLRGTGQVVDGDKGVAFLHKELSISGDNIAIHRNGNPLANGIKAIGLS